MAVADELEPIPVDSDPQPGRPSRVPVAAAILAIVLSVASIGNQVRLERRFDRAEEAKSVPVDAATTLHFRRIDETLTSLESRTVHVPRLVGRRVLDAMDLVSIAGLIPAPKPPTGGLDVPEQCVVRAQDPVPGTRLQLGTPVYLELEAPPNDASIRCT